MSYAALRKSLGKVQARNKKTDMWREGLAGAAKIGTALYTASQQNENAWKEYDEGAKKLDPSYESDSPFNKINQTDFKLFDTDLKTTWENWKGQATDIKTRFDTAFKSPEDSITYTPKGGKPTEVGYKDVRALGKISLSRPEYLTGPVQDIMSMWEQGNPILPEID